MILTKNDSDFPKTAAETRTKTRQNHYQQNHFWIGFKDSKDDDASNDLLLRIAAGAAHAERGVERNRFAE
jgi:hypothetical protein